MDYYINWGLCNLPTFKLPAVIATNGPKIRTRHSKLAQIWRENRLTGNPAYIGGITGQQVV